jgi:tetratricopeptide (TPR) repeat protein
MEQVLDKLLDSLLGRTLADVVGGWFLIVMGALLLTLLLYGLVRTLWERRRGLTQTTQTPGTLIVGLLLPIPVLFAVLLLYGGISLHSTARQQETFKRGSEAFANKDYDKAIEDFSEAIRLDPQSAGAYEYLAWIRATCPKAAFRDGNKAIEHATKACELSAWKDAGKIDTLAAADAEAGNFQEAVKWQKMAIERGFNDSALALRARARLNLYEEGKPYRDE